MVMLEAVGNGITAVIGWIGEVVTSLVTADGALYALLPMFAIGIAVSGILLAKKIMRGLVWGA